MVAPSKGDLVWINFDPTKGHEQKHHRPALVITPKKYNQKSGLMLVCPITSHIKNYPFEVTVELKAAVGAILVDQVRSVDWQARHTKKITTCPPEVLALVQHKLQVLIS